MRQALNHSYRFPQRAESVRTLCIRLPKVVLFLFLLLGAGSLAAQNTDQQIAAQKRLIADLEKQIAREEQEISKLKKGRASAEETVRRLARQIDSRNQLLDVTERDARKLEVEVARTDSVARGLSASLDAHKRRYAEMVREAYRNYKHNNYLTYLFSSSDFNQVARRITNLREVAAMRERQMEQIVTLSEQVSVERTRLTRAAAGAGFGEAQPDHAADPPAERFAGGACPTSSSSPRRKKLPCNRKSPASSGLTWRSTSCAS